MRTELERPAPVEQGRRRFFLVVVPWQVRLGALAAIWGMSFLFIKVGDEALAPLQVALGRLLFGTAVLILILAVRRIALPKGRRVWLHLAVAAALLNAIPFSLFAYGELHTTSVLAGIWNAATPLFVAPVAIVMLPGERLSRSRLGGLLLGSAYLSCSASGKEPRAVPRSATCCASAQPSATALASRTHANT